MNMLLELIQVLFQYWVCKLKTSKETLKKSPFLFMTTIYNKTYIGH